jgi:hypothetical protein
VFNLRKRNTDFDKICYLRPETTGYKLLYEAVDVDRMQPVEMILLSTVEGCIGVEDCQRGIENAIGGNYRTEELTA